MDFVTDNILSTQAVRIRGRLLPVSGNAERAFVRLASLRDVQFKERAKCLYPGERHHATHYDARWYGIHSSACTVP